MRLMHNLASLNIYREHTKVLSRQSKAMNRISSGLKINSAKEDPNALASSEKMRTQIRGLEMAQRNAQDGVSMLQTADGALDNIDTMLQRIRELIVQSGSGTNTIGDKNSIQAEIKAMIDGIDEIVNDTSFNGVELLSGKETSNLYMPTGANSGETVEIPVFNINSSKLGKTATNNSVKFLKDIDVTNGSNDNLSIIDNAINECTRIRSKYGALTNRFESTYNKTGEIHDLIVGSESKVRDADIAEEMMNLTRDNLLIEAGNAMMAQSNNFPQEILRILENVKAK